MPAPPPATAVRPVTLPAISLRFQLSDDNYTKELTEKTLLVLHHTVGGTAESTFNYWSYHLGIKDLPRGQVDRRSIGIELASEGALTKKDGKVLAFYNPSTGKGTPINHVEFDKRLYQFDGVIGHHQVRTDKTDVHPNFPWIEFCARLGIEQVPVA